MVSPRRPRERELRYHLAAAADLQRLNSDDTRLALRARALIGLVKDGEVVGQPLALLPSYGDLSDCRKIYFGVDANAPTHRIVYREFPDGSVQVVEVVAVEARDEGYVYLLAASRLNVLPAETRAKLNRVHQAVVQRRGARPTERRGR